MSKIIIDVNASVTSRLAFEPIADYDNKVVCNLVDVRVEDVSSDDDANWEYKGMSYKRLVFEYQQKIDQFNDRERFLTKAFLPFAFTKTNGEVRTEANIVKSYQELWKHTKHVHDQFQTVAGYRPIGFVPEFDPDLTLEDRLVQFGDFFTKMADAFNGADGKPFYKELELEMVIVAAGQKNSYYSTPDYVGKGYLAPAKFKNGKLDSALKLPSGATTVLGSAAIPQAAENPVAQNLNSDIMNLINARKQ